MTLEHFVVIVCGLIGSMTLMLYMVSWVVDTFRRSSRPPLVEWCLMSFCVILLVGLTGLTLLVLVTLPA